MTSLRQAETNYAMAKSQDDGSSMAARRLCFAAKALYDAAQLETQNRLVDQQQTAERIVRDFSMESVGGILGHHLMKGGSR